MYKFHHVGLAVTSIQTSLPFHLNFLGMKQISPIVNDPIQKVKVVLLSYNNTSQPPLLELVEPLADNSPIDQILKQRNHLYHYCLEVPSLDESLSMARKNRAIIVQKPVPAALFNGRRITWVWTPTHYLLELLEEQSHFE